VLVEIFDLSGQVTTFKRTAVVATRLD